MTIDFQVTPDDLIIYQLFSHRTIPSLRRMYQNTKIIGIISLVLSIIGIIFLPSVIKISAFCFIVISLYLLLISTIFSSYTIKAPMLRYIKKGFMNTYLGNHTITLLPEMYILKSKYTSTKTIWKVITSIYITKDYVFLFYSPIMAYPISKRNFPDQQTWQEFTTLLQTYSNKTILVNE